jgi:hypothetical protein
VVNVTYSLEGSNDDSITFDYSTYVLNTGLTGFGIPPTSVRIEPSAGDGGVYRHSKRLPRDVDLPITIFGADRGEVQENLRRLGRILQDNQGPTQIKADYSDGTSLFLPLHYTGGGETVWGSNTAGLTWCRWVISMRAPNPFWLSAIEEQFSIGTGSTGRGLLPLLTKMKVSSSSTLGVVTVVNAGDVRAFPIWKITGPVSDLVIGNGVEQFGFANVFSGEVITVNTETGSVTNFDGDNLYARLNVAPKLFSLPPGTTGLTILGIDTDLDFNVLLTYSPRYEVIH